jgi:hypothetical protein
VIRPESGINSVEISRMSVLFPVPFGPRIPKISLSPAGSRGDGDDPLPLAG